jgi:hypothetical protein
MAMPLRKSFADAIKTDDSIRHPDFSAADGEDNQNLAESKPGNEPFLERGAVRPLRRTGQTPLPQRKKGAKSGVKQQCGKAGP